MNDIQQGLQYENISYTKEQNEKLLNEIGTAKMNQQSAEAKVAILKDDLILAAESKCIKITKTETVVEGMYGERRSEWYEYKFFTEAHFLDEHTAALEKKEELNQSIRKLEESQQLLDGRLSDRIMQNWGIGITATLSTLALIAWIFF